ncbi:uncharacterized protein LOC136071041 [Quercus suber]|uniref:uncharacterized protein LOC136071041 n=1 Tax=Quercus suber TaxID=58331 RepID=UPI0032DF1801
MEFSVLEDKMSCWLERRFSEDEVFEVVFNMNGDKAPGPYGFTMPFFNLVGPRAVEIKDFRPISLISGVYKILANVLANRLEKVLHKVVSEPQNAFVKERQILDSVLIANECLDSHLKSEIPGVLCKLDLEKAYDHVHSNSQLYVLQRFSVGGNSRGQLEISRLLLAGDTLIFCVVNPEQIWHLKAMFVWFQIVSGLKLNLGKSELVLVADVQNVETLAGATLKAKAIWTGVLEKMEWRLGGWKRLYAMWGRGKWCSCSMQGPYEVGLWNYIRKGWDDFYPFIIFKARDGSCIKFWRDPWCEGLPLKNIFLELYNIASNKNASVAKLLLPSKANYHWNIRFT